VNGTVLIMEDEVGTQDKAIQDAAPRGPECAPFVRTLNRVYYGHRHGLMLRVTNRTTHMGSRSFFDVVFMDATAGGWRVVAHAVLPKRLFRHR